MKAGFHSLTGDIKNFEMVYIILLNFLIPPYNIITKRSEIVNNRLKCSKKFFTANKMCSIIK